MEQREDRSMTNIKAASYHELSRIAYENREWNQALSYIEEGISHFKEEGQRSHYKYLLQVSRIIYLNEANRLEEALRQIEKFWKEISCIESVDTVLELYMVRIKVLMKLKLHDEAIRYAIQGIELARINGKAGKACRLWQLMGKVYLLIKKWEEAEDCFLTVLSLQERLKNDLLKIRGQTTLGPQLFGAKPMERSGGSLERSRFGLRTIPADGSEPGNVHGFGRLLPATSQISRSHFVL